MSLKERNNNIYIKINKKEYNTKWRIAVFGNRKIKKSLGMTTFTDALMEFKTIMFIPIRRIICEGCGNIFYTMVPIKKYCNERCCYLGFWKHKREKRLAMRKDTVYKTCGNTFTPKRSDAVYCSNACRQKAYRQSVTDNGKCSKWTPTVICNVWGAEKLFQGVKLAPWNQKNSDA